jgi:catechol 2,3-dioxygenase-like lactoylglutathione lyase family enzyme
MTNGSFAPLHHVAVTVTDLDRSREWYNALFGAEAVVDTPVPAVEGHHKGYTHVVYALPGGALFGIHSHDSTEAGRFSEFRAGLDHVSFGAADRAEVERWAARLDELGIPHGGVLDDDLGHGVSFRDPDGIALEFWAPRG